MAFQIGERISDIRVFRFSLSPDGNHVEYIDNRGERDIALPPEYDLTGSRPAESRDYHGKFPHINILDTLFVDTINGDLTVCLRDTDTTQGIFSEPAEEKKPIHQ